MLKDVSHTCLEHHQSHVLADWVFRIGFNSFQKLFDKWVTRVDFQSLLLGQVIAVKEKEIE